jgi:hypothetical protein
MTFVMHEVKTLGLHLSIEQFGLAIKLWICIQEVLSSNVSWDTSYID